ncbi:MAG: TerC family protein [Gammaproteobacteria bacterium]
MIGTLQDPQFWVALLQIIWINILLSGDNAVVIALACRSLPPRQQRWGIILGAGAAVVLRILFTVVVSTLLKIPLLKILGSLALFWIAIKLLVPESEQDGPDVKAKTHLWGAVQTIAIADAVMSLDNVLGIVGVAKDSLLLIVLGLTISIPLVVFGSTLILWLLQRFPVIVTLGGALLGWVAAEIGLTDPVIADWIEHHMPLLHTVAPILGALFVVLVGHWLARRVQERHGEPSAGGDAATQADE